ncbi:MAG: substrate-binding domain-containing protein [Christensenellales bacterium]|jgi:phosphate transport system substrate-binding protein
MKIRKLLAIVAALTMVFSVALAAFDASQTISVVSREEGSGTRGAFIELTGIATKGADGKEVDNTYLEADFVNSTSLVMTTVASNEYAIGYASLSSVLANDTVKALKVNGVVASTEDILNQSYPIARPFNIVTKGELTDEIAKDFYAFIMSKEGQKVVGENGLVPVDTAETPAYEGKALEGKLTVGGSTSVTPIMEKLAEAYNVLQPKVVIDLQSTGSTAGVTGALDGTYQLGMASRGLKDSEKENGAVGTVIAMDGIAVIVHPDNPIEDLTVEQIRQVFVGEVTTWDALNK